VIWPVKQTVEYLEMEHQGFKVELSPEEFVLLFLSAQMRRGWGVSELPGCPCIRHREQRCLRTVLVLYRMPL
jgi:hypothetical protein